MLHGKKKIFKESRPQQKHNLSVFAIFPEDSKKLQLVKNTPAIQDSGSIPGLGRSAGEGIGYPLQYSWASVVAQLVKNLPAMRETWVRSLGWEDP